MNLNEINKKQYVDWKVKPVMCIKEKYGFRISLIMSDDSIVIQQKSGFLTKKEANKKRNNVIAELTNRTYIVEDKVKLKDYIIAWLEQIMKLRITNNTYVSYSNSIYKYIIPNIGNIYLTSMTSGDITRLYKKIFSLTKSGVGIARTILKTAFDYAILKKLTNINPVINAKMPKDFKSKPYRILNIESSKTLTLKQVQILINASIGTKIHMQVLFATLMGLRKSEINGLKYSDIDYIKRTIKIQRQLGIKPNTKKEDFALKTYTKQEIELKTLSSYRELNIPDYVFEEILKERELYNKRKNRRKKEFQDLDYICCSTYGRPRSKSYVSPHFKKLLKDNDLPNIRWHDLRATFATILLKNNYSAKAVSALLGHSKEIITVDVYGDNQKIIEDCLEELEPFIEEVIPPKEEYDFTEDNEYSYLIDEYYNEIKEDIKMIRIENLLKDYALEDEYTNIFEEYISGLKFLTRI